MQKPKAMFIVKRRGTLLIPNEIWANKIEIPAGN
jgi:hypothetical protein